MNMCRKLKYMYLQLLTVTDYHSQIDTQRSKIDTIRMMQSDKHIQEHNINDMAWSVVR